MMTISQIESILVVAEELHFGRAARRLHITQPSLSIQIQKAEQELGFTIFERSKQPLKITERGIEFIQQSQEVLKSFKRLMDASKKVSKGLSGEIHLGIIPTIAPYLLPILLPTFVKKYPDAKLIISEKTTEEILRALRSDQLDLGILSTPLKEKEIHEVKIYTEELMLYTAQNSPLLKTMKISPDDLDASELWMLQDGHCLKNQVLSLCGFEDHSQVLPSVQFAGGNLETLRNLIKKVGGTTIVPELLTLTLTKTETENHIREFSDPKPKREVSIVYRRLDWRRPFVTALRETMESLLPKHMLKKAAPTSIMSPLKP